LSIHALVVKICCADGEFLHPVLSASRMQLISDLHSKFALRPHHVWKYPICNCWYRWGKKKTERRKKPQRQNI